MNLLNSMLDKLDFWVIGIVLCSGFFQTRYLKAFRWSKDPSYDSALKTLALSAVVSSIYILLAKDTEKANNWAKYFVSYFAATSLYELLVNPFIKLIQKATGQKETGE